MLQFFVSLCSICFLFSCQSANKKEIDKPSKPQQELVCELSDSTKINTILQQYKDSASLSASDLVVSVGQQFLGTPYVAHTLEHGKNEPLTVETDGLDCTTFVETVLALVKTIKSADLDFDHYTGELEKIRYRDEKREGYASRLHYFSDWIYNNQQKGLVSQPAESFGEPLAIQVDFMSTHPESYAILKKNPELVNALAQQEKEISQRDYYYLPKTDFEANENQLQAGDLIGLVTSIKGLDIAHSGILVEIDGRIHLMHASSLGEKVMISEEPLDNLLQNKKSYLGIMVARPINK